MLFGVTCGRGGGWRRLSLSRQKGPSCSGCCCCCCCCCARERAQQEETVACTGRNAVDEVEETRADGSLAEATVVYRHEGGALLRTRLCRRQHTPAESLQQGPMGSISPSPSLPLSHSLEPKGLLGKPRGCKIRLRMEGKWTRGACDDGRVCHLRNRFLLSTCCSRLGKCTRKRTRCRYVNGTD